MDRRRLLIVAAALVAALGTALVVIYARGADQRAEDRFEAVDVLVATQPITAGETVEAAQAAGKIGTGFDTKLLLSLREQLDRIEIPATPFTRAKGLPRLRAHWVKPEIVVQVAFIEWTVHGKLRHPRLIAVRTDKPAREVVRETP